MATVGQRIKVAQAQKGISVPQIAAQAGRPARFGAKTIGRVIRGQRELQPHEADWLGRVLGVPAEFFFVEAPAPGSTEDRTLAVLESVEALLQKQNGLLSRQSKILERIEAAIEREDLTATEGARLLHQAAEHIALVLPAAVQDPAPEPTEHATSGSQED